MLTRRAFTLALLAAPASAHAASALDDLQSKLKRIHDSSTSHAERLDRVSRLFVSKPYHLNPLGEGPQGDRDKDPIADFSRFDCVTYVEEVMALAKRSDLDEAITYLQRIRYLGGAIDYGLRKHITMAQWIPQNIAAGFIEDITRPVGGAEVTEATLVLTHADFESAKGKVLKLERDERPLGTHRVPIVSPAMLPEKRLPPSTLITTIRARRQGVPYRASHIAFAAKPDTVRHAHQTRGRVITESLDTFVKRARTANKWPLSGFNLTRVR